MALILRIERSDDDVASLTSIGVVTELQKEPTLDRVVLCIDLAHVDILPRRGKRRNCSSEPLAGGFPRADRRTVGRRIRLIQLRESIAGMEDTPNSAWNERYEESIRKEQEANPVPHWLSVYDSLHLVYLASVVAAALVSGLLRLAGVRSVPLMLALVVGFFGVGLVLRRKIREMRRR